MKTDDLKLWRPVTHVVMAEISGSWTPVAYGTTYPAFALPVDYNNANEYLGVVYRAKPPASPI